MSVLRIKKLFSTDTAVSIINCVVFEVESFAQTVSSGFLIVAISRGFALAYMIQ